MTAKSTAYSNQRVTQEYLEFWRKNLCEQQASGTREWWRRQRKIQMDGDNWSVGYAPLGV